MIPMLDAQIVDIECVTRVIPMLDAQIVDIDFFTCDPHVRCTDCGHRVRHV